MPALGALTVTPQGVPSSDRIAAAFGRRLNLFDTEDPPQPRAATKAEIQQQMAQFIINAVQEQEQPAAAQAAVDAIVPVVVA